MSLPFAPLHHYQQQYEKMISTPADPLEVLSNKHKNSHDIILKELKECYCRNGRVVITMDYSYRELREYRLLSMYDKGIDKQPLITALMNIIYLTLPEKDEKYLHTYFRNKAYDYDNDLATSNTN